MSGILAVILCSARFGLDSKSVYKTITAAAKSVATGPGCNCLHLYAYAEAA